MEQQPPNASEVKPLAAPQQLNTSEGKPSAPSQPLHASDVEDDDENVKQLDECSSLYLLMQVGQPHFLLHLPITLNPQIFGSINFG